MDLRFKTFSDEVRRHFDFLLTQYGFTGPIEDNRPAPLDRLMTYASSAVTVNVGLALGPASDQSVNTWLELRTPDESISVDLEEVFGAARLGPVNSVGTGAQTRHAMSKSIAAQGGALREVLPVVLAPAGAVLMQGTRRSLRRPLRRSPGVGGSSLDSPVEPQRWIGNQEFRPFLQQSQIPVARQADVALEH